MSDCMQTEVLIIGCGMAGGTAALTLANAGIQVTVISRSTDPHDSNTYHAQGGIIYKGEEDSEALFMEDLARVGAEHCNPRAIEILAKEGPPLVKKILVDQLGVSFNQDKHKKIEVIQEAGHSTARIAHSDDVTGKAISIQMMKAIQNHHNIHLLTAHTAIDLLTPSHHSLNRLSIYDPLSCVGAYILDQKQKKVLTCLAKKTILASGGLGRIFLRTTNPNGARGDGLAMAYRSGARVINCEFIQFHPTAFFYEEKSKFLISEAVRGAGAKLVHKNKKPFMEKYAPKWKDLAPRDIVARSIHQEMLEKGVPQVYLDLPSYLSKEEITQKFPNIYHNCLKYGIDATKDLVPVVPAAHYFCGGVWCDEWGQSTLKNLYALGEVSCTGVHGANRLGSASLLEGLVWGYRGAKHIQKTLKEASYIQDIPSWKEVSKEPADLALIRQDMNSIQNIMWNYVGLVRSTKLLSRALRELLHLEVEIERFYQVVELTDEILGLRNAVRTAVIVSSAAWQNRRNMGCHYRI